MPRVTLNFPQSDATAPAVFGYHGGHELLGLTGGVRLDSIGHVISDPRSEIVARVGAGDATELTGHVIFRPHSNRGDARNP